MSAPTAAVVLAAGPGRRMISDIPQVLHKVADLPLICHAINIVLARGWSPVAVVVSPQSSVGIREVVQKHLPGAEIQFTEQQEPNGVLHAAEMGIQALGSFQGNVIVLPGNMPLLQPDTTLLCLETMIAGGATGSQEPYVGLQMRGSGRALPVFCAERRWLELALRAVTGRIGGGDKEGSSADAWIQDLQQSLPISTAEAEGDALAQFSQRGFGVNAANEDEICMVTSRAALATAEKALCRRLISQRQAQGATFRDPDNTFLGANVVIGRDTTIGYGVQIYGETVIGQRVRIEGPTTIMDSSIEDDVYIRSFSSLEGAHVSQGSGAGPYARLREGTVIGQNSYIGNFVETKNATLGSNTLACHLSYLGDADIGSRTNIGAGTITCNFDGAAKNATTIGDNAFVGSNTTLVAPVKVGSKSIVAAGSVITNDISADAVAFGRARQSIKQKYADNFRQKLRDRHRK